MFYTGESAAVALWETVLRKASIVDGWVTTPREHLEGMKLARIELVTSSAEVLDLRPPHRRQLVATTGTPLEAE